MRVVCAQCGHDIRWGRTGWSHRYAGFTWFRSWPPHRPTPFVLLYTSPKEAA